jgi:hypothetical protein
MNFLTSLLRKFQKPRVIYVLRKRDPFPPEELAAILRGWDETDPRLCALQDLIEAQKASVILQISDPKNARETESTTFLAGALEAIRALEDSLESHRNSKP